jgi:glycosyltransferase involved in cell wall biosynthesis
MSADRASDIRPDAAPWTLGALEARRNAVTTMRALSPPQTVSAVIVVDSGDDDTSERVRARGGSVRLVKTGDIRAAARNYGAGEAMGDLLLLLDDDSYPLPGRVNTLRDAFNRDQGLALAAGLVLEADRDDQVIYSQEVGTFDWFLRAGHRGPVSKDGVPTFTRARGRAA